MSELLPRPQQRPVAIIPARGGSKRITRKNIKMFLGQPILWYPIQAALRSEIFEHVIVSTDDEEIARVALEAGASVPFLRTAENASDQATTVSVLLEVLERLNTGSLESICCLYPTSIFATSDFIANSYDKFLESNCSTAACVVEYEHPVQRAIQFAGTEGDRKVTFAWPEYALSRTQDLPKYYHDAGMLYWAKVRRLQQDRAIFTSNTCGIVVDRAFSQDIDTIADWNLAELKFKMRGAPQVL